MNAKAAAALVVACIMLAGCGGSAGSGSTDRAAAAEARARAAIERLLPEGRKPGAGAPSIPAGGVELTPKQAEKVLRELSARQRGHKDGKNAVETLLEGITGGQ
jgi:hypothetical protein